MYRFAALILIALLGSVACSDDTGPAGPAWQMIHEELPGALISVWGTSSTDVWVVGADPDDGGGPMVLHFDGTAWTRKATGASGDLWWVTGFAGGPVFMGGADGLVLRYSDGQFAQVATPGVGTIFGMWGAAPDDVWATGGNFGGSGGAFAWHYTGDTFVDAAGFPTELAGTHTLWKVHGRSASDIWYVGTSGLTMHYDGDTFEQIPSGVTDSLFTVHGNSQVTVAVGGYPAGRMLEYKGTEWTDVTVPGMEQMIGVHLSQEDGYAVGFDGAVYRRSTEGWQAEETKLQVYDQFHAVWIDPDGGVWAVGGQTVSLPLVRGMLIYKGMMEIPGGEYVEE